MSPGPSYRLAAIPAEVVAELAARGVTSMDLDGYHVVIGRNTGYWSATVTLPRGCVRSEVATRRAAVDEAVRIVAEHVAAAKAKACAAVQANEVQP